MKPTYEEAKEMMFSRVLKIGIWVIMFMASSWFLMNYEAVTGANLWSEGLVGYSALGLILFSALMFSHEFLEYLKKCQSLCHSDEPNGHIFSLSTEVKNK